MANGTYSSAAEDNFNNAVRNTRTASVTDFVNPVDTVKANNTIQSRPANPTRNVTDAVISDPSSRGGGNFGGAGINSGGGTQGPAQFGTGAKIAKAGQLGALATGNFDAVGPLGIASTGFNVAQNLSESRFAKAALTAASFANPVVGALNALDSMTGNKVSEFAESALHDVLGVFGINSYNSITGPAPIENGIFSAIDVSPDTGLTDAVANKFGAATGADGFGDNAGFAAGDFGGNAGGTGTGAGGSGINSGNVGSIGGLGGAINSGGFGNNSGGGNGGFGGRDGMGSGAFGGAGNTNSGMSSAGRDGNYGGWGGRDGYGGGSGGNDSGGGVGGSSDGGGRGDHAPGGGGGGHGADGGGGHGGGDD